MDFRGTIRVAAMGVLAVALAVGGAVPSWAADQQPVAVSGTVTLDGKPSQGTKVCDLSGRSECADTDASGHYSINVYYLLYGRVPSPSQLCLAVTPGVGQHFAPRGSKTGMYFCDEYVEATAGATEAIHDISLASLPVVTGQVVDAKGRPVAGATIDSHEPSTPAFDDETRVTGADGRFRVWQVYHYLEPFLTVTAPGYNPAYSRDLTFSGNIGRIVLAAEGSAQTLSISGRVTDFQGRPVPGAEVRKVGGVRIGFTDSQGYYFGLISQSATDGISVRLQAVSSDGNGYRVTTFTATPRDYVTGWDFRVRALLSSKPVIVGTPKVGAKLVARAGVWTPAPVALSYQWYANGVKIKGAKKSSLRLTRSVVKKRITVKVTGSKKGYRSVARASAATTKVR